MFTLEGVIKAPNSAEATAQYWAWRASQAGSPEAKRLIRSKMHQTDPQDAGETSTNDSAGRTLADRIVAIYGGPSTEAGRIAIYQALRADLELGLQETPQKRDGVLYQTDYSPVGRMATALAGVDPTGVPTRTTTSAHLEFAYVREQGEPLTVVLHGDFLVAQAHLVEVHHFTPSEIVPLNSANS